MRSCPPLKGLSSINLTLISMGETSSLQSYTDCRLMQQLRNENIGFYQKHLWFQNFNLNRDKAYTSKIVTRGEEESERVKEIQRKIRVLQESNDLLISYIRQLYNLSQSPTRADLDYLNHLFRVDEEHLLELSESLTKGKLAIDRKSGKQKEEPPTRSCRGNCNCNVCGCCNKLGKSSKKKWVEREYVIVESGPSSPAMKPISPINHDRTPKARHAKRMGDTNLTLNLLRCPYLDFNVESSISCESRDLLKMEKELETMEKRMKGFNVASESDSDSEWILVEIDKKKTTNRFTKCAMGVDNLKELKSVEKKHKSRNGCAIA